MLPSKSSSVRAFFVFCAVAGLTGCRGGPAVPCTSMEAPSELVTNAALFRIDVYSTESNCSDAGGPAGTPVLTRSFAPGQGIAFDVAPGRRPVVLVSFADAAATMELGRACSEAELGEGRAVCLDLKLERAPDLSTTPPDMAEVISCDVAGPSACGALTCCESVCRDVSSDVGHCGGCRACAAEQVATPSCEGGLCRSTCLAGYGNCVQPAAPAADDGCETDLTTTAASCGACGRACSMTSTAMVACAGGVCSSTCAAGFANCSTPAAPLADDGCETAISASTTSCGGCGRGCASANVQTLACAAGLCTSTCVAGRMNCARPAAPSVDDGCECAGTACCAGNTCQTQHTNGVGNTFFDCVALGTHNLAQATAAGDRWPVTLAVPAFNSTACANAAPMRCYQTATSCACWGYSTGAVNAGDGRVRLNTVSNGCMCPTVGDAAWN